MLRQFVSHKLPFTSLFHIPKRFKHTLPTLNGCEPWDGMFPLYSPKALHLHFNKHHGYYVMRFNEIIGNTKYEGQPLDKIIQRTYLDITRAPLHQIACTHYNHLLFWKCLTPLGSDMTDDLKQILKRDFGSVDGFLDQFVHEAMTLEGSGWQFLVYDGKKWKIWKGENAACPITKRMIPVLACDLWEHAWYYDFQDDKEKYLTNFLDTVNWVYVGNMMKHVEAITTELQIPPLPWTWDKEAFLKAASRRWK